MSYKSPVMTADALRRTIKRSRKPAHWNGVGEGTFSSEDGGPRLMRSVMHVRNCHGYAVHPTQKPVGVVAPLVEYSVPPGGLVLDLFVGSGTVLQVAKDSGRRAIGFEADERYCEVTANRLSQEVFAL